MVKRRRYSKEEKLRVLTEIRKNNHSISEVAKKYAIHYTTIVKWLYHYEMFGFQRLKNFSSRKAYTNEEKLEAVLAVVEGNMSIRQATKTFQISSHSVLSNWILSYANSEILKTTSKGCPSNMPIKGRNTTYQERIEIVQYTIANDLNYNQRKPTVSLIIKFILG
ncbi:helix-turn-helix domain-containing protein [Vagococcus xieshaowenii]|uniref:Transposase n=1 Tax=Vagococcus xieshaowenii TaxID=2562451 RepID=A0AAJ5EG19_9ENTE|nr:helix-turn-helix domain-containing protein [Vagococcus xieshaowenii]QCA28849.1 transposase [Vagococcus xieshaowenii]TFZ43444.1 transposase [Vagococcus xieshaowenii]